ncbi:hypothetical protein Q9251_02920 [Alkalihalobacillus macyae]|uniref:hypothetical protein n=1 Tax=Guptibacillus hwajinpoensis TaxID=208199 RepID=UPI00273CCBC8|nr:hypothetical protein [Alkalihalobacillus macyae]MDP4549827.1 hypothetical protein [Alkalihalobacillus macyae]
MVYRKYGGNDKGFTPQQLQIMQQREKAELKKREENSKKKAKEEFDQQAQANSDKQIIEILVKEKPQSESILMTERIFNRLLKYYPDHFIKKEKVNTYKHETGSITVLFHSELDGDIRVI